MKYLFIDTETTGLQKDKNLSPMQSDRWPRLVSLAYILCDERDIIEQNYFIIKPNGFIIPSEATKVHGITTAEAVSKGNALSEVLSNIRQKIEECDYIVGHNVSFDINILNSEYYRYDKTLPVSLRPYYCTMTLSKDSCGLPNNKYPTLEELYETLTGKSIANAHNAMADTQAAMECFWILIDSGIVKTQTTKPEIKIYPTEDNLSWATEHALKSPYAAKARAFLALAYNLKYNKTKFFGLSIRTPYHKNELIKNPSTIIVEENGQIINKEYTEKCWIDDSINYYSKEICIEGARNRIKEAVDNILNEVGGKSLLDEFQLKKPSVFRIVYKYVREDDWLDMAINVSKNRSPFPSNTEINYFKLFVKHLNKIREAENEKQRGKHYETKEYFAKYGVDIDKGEIPNEKQVQQMFRDREQITNKIEDDNSYNWGLIIALFVFIIGVVMVIITNGKHNETTDIQAIAVDSVEVMDSLEEVPSYAFDGNEGNENQMKTYSSNSYSIQYPKNWVVTENLNEMTDVHIGSTEENIGFTILHFNTDQSLEEIQKSSDENMVEAGFDIVEKQKLNINGAKVLETTYFIINKDADFDIMKDDFDKINIKFKSYLIKKNGVLYNIKFGNCFKEEHSKIAQQIIATLKIF